MSILEKMNSQADLLALDDAQREQLCHEIRQFLVDHLAKTGGHLASNLGVVELTVAIETVFNTDKDRLVFDVGHQSYVHKLLTGRQAGFDSLRTFGGLAGFPKPGESHTDAFVAGHASSSVSVALGMARARSLVGDDYDVIALLGDGAATGGMVYEGLNDAAESGEPIIVILNDNEMSIDHNVGGMAKHLSRLRTKSGYLGAKKRYRSFLKKLPGGKWLYRVTSKLKDWVRRVLIPTTIFENMGLTYFGPVDGHDLPELISVLQNAREVGRPVLVHVHTRKGMGYAPAEEDPSHFHGVGSFDPYTGRSDSKKNGTFSEAFGETLCGLAEKNTRVCAITAAMPAGTGLMEFKKRFPSRLFDVGIAEEHAVSLAGGLAKQGAVPVVALYSTFLQRSFDQLIQDVAMLGLHVVFAIDRAGLVGEDGETHHGIFDVGFLRQIPGMRILAPATTEELRQMLTWAVEMCDGPVAIRYPRGGDRGALMASDEGAVVRHRSGEKLAFITYGTVAQNVMDAADILFGSGIQAAVFRLRELNPLPVDTISRMLQGYRYGIIVEEASANSCIAPYVVSALAENKDLKLHALDLGAGFVPHGSMGDLYQHCGLDVQSLATFALEVVRDEN